MLRLVEPAPAYKVALLEAAHEMYALGEWKAPPDAIAVQFTAMLRTLALAKDPATAPPGVLTYMDFWLLAGDVWIGLLTLRLHINAAFLRSGGHIGYVIRPTWRRQGYGTTLLRLGLAQARAHRLARVLLTCDETNIASRKVIEANGERFENTVLVVEHPIPVRRYWIDLGPQRSDRDDLDR